MKNMIFKLFTTVVATTVLFTSCKKPSAEFSSDKTEARTGEVITFTNGSTNNDKGLYIWDFGDGTSSNAVNPTHVYQRPGEYIVKLIASKKKTFKNLSEAAPLTIIITGVSADFTAPTTAYAGEIVTFTNKTDSTDVERFVWDFGDGTSSEAYNPTHVYAMGGTYTASLTAYGINQASISTKTATVTVTGQSTNQGADDKILGSYRITEHKFTHTFNGATVPSTAVPCLAQPITYPFTSTNAPNKYEFLPGGNIITYDFQGNMAANGTYSIIDNARMYLTVPSIKSSTGTPVAGTAFPVFVYQSPSTGTYNGTSAPIGSASIITLDATTLKVEYRYKQGSYSFYSNCSAATGTLQTGAMEMIETITFTRI